MHCHVFLFAFLFIDNLWAYFGLAISWGILKTWGYLLSIGVFNYSDNGSVCILMLISWENVEVVSPLESKT